MTSLNFSQPSESSDFDSQRNHLNTADSFYIDKLEKIQSEGNYRTCKSLTTQPQEGMVRYQDKVLVNFSSNNYLGLAQDPRLKKAAVDAIMADGVGAGASRLVSGTSPWVNALEEAVSKFKSTQSALVFGSGYQANVSILQALVSSDDWIIFDKLNHASLIDGCLLSKANWTRYHHRDMNHLEEKLKSLNQKLSGPGKPVAKWIVTDSVFSMDGDCAPLKEIVALAEKYGAFVMVDEAHATGFYGNNRNSGLSEFLGVHEQITLQMGTFSKALGGLGGYAACSEVIQKILVNKGRGFIYSTALPPSVLAAASKAVEVVQTDLQMKNNLWRNIHLMNEALEKENLKPYVPTFPLESPIFPIVLKNSSLALMVAEKLLDLGFFVQAIRPPTVPINTARLRITVSALHTPEQILQLTSALSMIFMQNNGLERCKNA
ncbi:MAG: pyridoxal phosphate-dependent aminotransferase family protein [Cyanobacteria bacterium]|nr:pyridoxal phosphate-dependent aminotransferase family protein [Cyanobacteriota bacterium]